MNRRYGKQPSNAANWATLEEQIMAAGKVLSLTLQTMDQKGRPLDSPRVTAEVSLVIEVPIPYEDMANPGHVVQEYVRGLGPQFAAVVIENPDDLIVRS
jgi:hypothetical protein